MDINEMVAEHTGTNFIRDTLLGGNDALYTGLSVATTVLGFVGPGGAVNAASRVDDVAGAASGANRADDAASAGPSANRIDDALDNKPTESPAKPDTTPTTPADDHKPVGECSFTGDTLVLLADGSQVAISSVRVGGQVTSTDPGTGVQSQETVTGVWPHSEQIWILTLSDGTTIDTTANHPWWVESERAFIRTDHLDSGDQVLTVGGVQLTVTGVEWTDRWEDTYNLTASGPHTYHVSQAGILVHNCGPGDTPAGPSSTPIGPVGQKPTSVLSQIDATGQAPPGYRGGGAYSNDGRGGTALLPGNDVSGTPITYQEWDVNPLVPGQNRGTERLVTGSDGSAYYTSDHYFSFIKIR